VIDDDQDKVDWIDKNLELLIDSATEWRDGRHGRSAAMNLALIKSGVEEIERLLIESGLL